MSECGFPRSHCRGPTGPGGPAGRGANANISWGHPAGSCASLPPAVTPHTSTSAAPRAPLADIQKGQNRPFALPHSNTHTHTHTVRHKTAPFWWHRWAAAPAQRQPKAWMDIVQMQL